MLFNKQRKFRAINVNGEIYETYNIRDFAIKNNLIDRTISRKLNGEIKKKDYKGWTFEYIE